MRRCREALSERAMAGSVCIATAAWIVIVFIFVVETALFGAIGAWYLWKQRQEKLGKGGGTHPSKSSMLKKMASGKMRKKKESSSTEPWAIRYKDVKFKDKLAHGNFGEVWVGQWLGSPVAIKTVLPAMANDEDFIERFVMEIKLMSNLHHPNIVMFLGACITPVERMCLVLEYCVHGNMHEFLRGEERSNGGNVINITLHMVIKFATDIARGVHYIHQKKNIIQRDLKSRNVLVDLHLNAKVADFGLSRLKEEDIGMTACGTPAWTAPEIVRMEQYDEKVDVYSFGIVMWELITREEPYDGQGGVQIAYAAAEQGLRPPIPNFCPDDFSKLMQECWAEKPASRPDFGEVLERLFQMMKDTPNPALKELQANARAKAALAKT